MVAAWSELKGPLGIAVIVFLALPGIVATLNESVIDKGEYQITSQPTYIPCRRPIKAPINSFKEEECPSGFGNMLG
jgi:hypothetical protein